MNCQIKTCNITIFAFQYSCKNNLHISLVLDYVMVMRVKLEQSKELEELESAKKSPLELLTHEIKKLSSTYIV